MFSDIVVTVRATERTGALPGLDDTRLCRHRLERELFGVYGYGAGPVARLAGRGI